MNSTKFIVTYNVEGKSSGSEEFDSIFLATNYYEDTEILIRQYGGRCSLKVVTEQEVSSSSSCKK